MSRGRLWYMVGCSRSGKSTYCRNWVRQIGDRPRVIVSGDAFRQAVYGAEYNYELEDSVFTAMDVATRALLNSGFDVIIDETCTTRETLFRYLKIDIHAEYVIQHCPLDECVERAYQTQKEYLVPVIKRMYPQYRDMIVNIDKYIEDIQERVLMMRGHDEKYQKEIKCPQS